MLPAIDALLTDTIKYMADERDEDAVLPERHDLLVRAKLLHVEFTGAMTLKLLLLAIKKKRKTALAQWASAVRGTRAPKNPGGKQQSHGRW